MDKKSLKILRLICPGVIFFLYALPLLFRTNFIKSFIQLDDYTRYLCILLFVTAFGAIYYILGIRNIFWRQMVLDLHNNIRNTFFDFFKSETDIRNIIKSLSDVELMSIFYKLIDDESLKDKQNDVRLNGLILTTVLDTQLLLFLFVPSYLLFCFMEKKYYYIIFITILSIILFLLLNVFKSKLKKKHFEYQNEQLTAIRIIHLNNLKKLLGKC